MRRKTVEAALFLASGPLSITDLIAIAECNAGELDDEIRVLKEKYGDESGVKLIEANQSYQFIVHPDVIPKVKQLSPYRDLSPGLVKALSVIAFKGPLKQSVLVNTIGNRAYEYTGELEKRGLITAKKEGRTRILKVTKHFVDYFGASVPANNLERFLEDEVKGVELKDLEGAEEDADAPKKKKSKYFRDDEEADDEQLIEEQEMLEDAEEVKGESEMGAREINDAPDEVEEK